MTTCSPRADRAKILEASSELLGRARAAAIPVKALGGVAIAIECPSASTAPLVRDFSDLDVAVPGRSAAEAAGLIESCGYRPDREFNALNGHRRQLFDREDVHLDLFVGRFEMCHAIDFSFSAGPERVSIDATELLLTKLQVVELTRKDVLDVAALALDHRPGVASSEIDHGRIAQLFAKDWGWWRTGTHTLSALIAELPALLDDERLPRALHHLKALAAEIESEPKSLRWRARARIGERVPWYEQPEAAE